MESEYLLIDYNHCW